MNNLQNLKIWQMSFDLAKEVYAVSKTLPKEEKYEMGSQIRRCSSSIPANIAEGAGRNSDKEFLHFLAIANGSCLELETFVLLAYEVEYIDEKTKTSIIDKNNQIMKMNNRLQLSIKNKLK